MPAQTLIPGYKQVEEFGPDEDYEEEEVSYLTLDLGAVEPTLLPSSSTYRLIGLDTPTPFLQLSGSIFKGQHDTLLGTELLFTEEKNDTESNRRSLAHVGSTGQRIRFKEVQLKKKTAAATSTPGEVTATERDHSKTRSTSSDQFLERLTGHSSAAVARARKKGSRKGKEREVDANIDDDVMDTS